MRKLILRLNRLDYEALLKAGYVTIQPQSKCAKLPSWWKRRGKR